MSLINNIIDDDFRLLLRAMADVSNKADSEQIKKGEWGLNALGLHLKAFYHFSAMYYLAQRTKTDYLKVEFEDPSSLPVLLRAAWESFLVLSYVFADPPSESEGLLRHSAWQLSGLLSRQKINPISRRGQIVKEEDFVHIRELQTKIKSHPNFSMFTDGERNNILNKGQWRLPVKRKNGNRIKPSWNEIAVNAGMSKKVAEETYNYLSGYAHSSYLSMFQITQADKSEDRLMLMDGALSTAKIVMAMITRKYIKVFPSGRIVLDTNSDYNDAVEIWCRIGSGEIDDSD